MVEVFRLDQRFPAPHQGRLATDPPAARAGPGLAGALPSATSKTTAYLMAHPALLGKIPFRRSKGMDRLPDTPTAAAPGCDSRKPQRTAFAATGWSREAGRAPGTPR